jgi:hypothetical protein
MVAHGGDPVAAVWWPPHNPLFFFLFFNIYMLCFIFLKNVFGFEKNFVVRFEKCFSGGATSQNSFG